MFVRTSLQENGIGILTFSHPPLNILTRALLAELRVEIARLAGDRRLRALIVTGDGEHFSAGADVREHLPPEFGAMIPEFVETIASILRFPVPVLAVVRGRCLGGGFEIVQAADLIVAGETASFGQPEIQLGVIAPIACALLPRRCRPGVAAEILYTGEAVGAARALEEGLVDAVTPDTEAMTAALALAARVARHSAAALRATKRALRLGASGAADSALESAGAFYVNELMRTRDAHEGLHAFLEKRRPVWTNE